MSWDESLFRAANGLAGRSSTLDWVMVELAKPGNLLYPILLVSGYWIWMNWREWLIASATLAAVIGITDAIGTQLKELIQRPRPCLHLQNIHELLGCGGAFSSLPTMPPIRQRRQPSFKSSTRSLVGSVGLWSWQSVSPESISGLIMSRMWWSGGFSVPRSAEPWPGCCAAGHVFRPLRRR